MKSIQSKLLFLCSLIAVSFCLVSMPLAEMSEEKTADALCVTGSGYLREIMIGTDGTNAVTISVYDNTAASGTELIPTCVITTDTTTDRAQKISFPEKLIPFHKGVYVDITCSGTLTYIVYYDD